MRNASPGLGELQLRTEECEETVRAGNRGETVSRAAHLVEHLGLSGFDRATSVWAAARGASPVNSSHIARAHLRYRPLAGPSSQTQGPGPRFAACGLRLCGRASFDCSVLVIKCECVWYAIMVELIESRVESYFN